MTYIYFFSYLCCCRASKGIFYTCPIGTRRHKRLSVLSVYGGPVRHKCLRSSIFLLCMPCQYETNYHQSGRAGKFPLGGSAWAGGRVGSVAVTHKRCVCVFEVGGVCVSAVQLRFTCRRGKMCPKLKWYFKERMIFVKCFNYMCEHSAFLMSHLYMQLQMHTYEYIKCEKDGIE